MPPPTPQLADQDVCAFLASALGTFQGVAWVSSGAGQNIWPGPIRPQTSAVGGVPADGLFVEETDGPAPLPLLGTSSVYHYAIMVTVRFGPNATDSGFLVAKAVRDSLHRAVVPSQQGGGYFRCVVRQSSPVYKGADEAGNDLWSVNILLSGARSP